MSQPIYAIMAIDNHRQLRIPKWTARKPHEGCLLRLHVSQNTKVYELSFLIEVTERRRRKSRQLTCTVFRNGMRINEHNGSPDSVIAYIQVVVYNELNT